MGSPRGMASNATWQQTRSQWHPRMLSFRSRSAPALPRAQCWCLLPRPLSRSGPDSLLQSAASGSQCCPCSQVTRTAAAAQEQVFQRNLMANAKSHACRLLHFVLGNPLEERAWTAGQLVNQVALTWHPHELLLNNSQKLKRRLSRKRRHHLWTRSSRLCWRHSSTGPRRGRAKGAVARLRSNLDDSFTPGMPLQRRRKPQLGMARLRVHAMQL